MINSEAEYKREFAHLAARLDTEPQQVLSEANALLGKPGTNAASRSLAAPLLIEAGQLVKDRNAVKLGVEIYETIKAETEASQQEASLEVLYNLANGLEALASLNTTPTPRWYLVTHKHRIRARHLFWQVQDEVGNGALKATSLTNLGNSLSRAHRWLEAYIFYKEAAIGPYPNGFAALQIALLSSRCLIERRGEPEAVAAVAKYHILRAKEHEDSILRTCGPQAVAMLDRLIVPDLEAWHPRTKPHLDEFQAFVSRNHLTLNPTLEVDSLEPDRWDDLLLAAITEPLRTGEPGHRAPSIFTLLNCLKQDYLLARRLLFEAKDELYKVQSGYVNTLDYAEYGEGSAKLTLAQRAAMDLLDRIAVGMDLYLSAGTKAKDITFRQYFRRGEKKPKWSPMIASEMRSECTGLIALSEIAEDIKSGFLAGKVKYRNTSTHKYTVLHSEGLHRSAAEEGYVDRYLFEDFVGITIETMQLARSALVYFVEFINQREARNRGNGLAVPMYLPPS